MDLKTVVQNAIKGFDSKNATEGGADKDETLEGEENPTGTQDDDQAESGVEADPDDEDGNDGDDDDDDDEVAEDDPPAGDGTEEEEEPEADQLTDEARAIATEIGSEALTVVNGLFNEATAPQLLPSFFQIVEEKAKISRADLITMLGGQAVPEGIDFEQWDEMEPEQRKKAFDEHVKRETEKQVKPIRDEIAKAQSASATNAWVDQNLEAVRKVFKAEGYDKFKPSRANLLAAIGGNPDARKSPEAAARAVKARYLDQILKVERQAPKRKKGPTGAPDGRAAGAQPATRMGDKALKAMNDNARRRGR